MNLTKLRVLKFTVGNPSCHSARRTSLSGVAESIIGSPIDSATPFHFTQNDDEWKLHWFQRFERARLKQVSIPLIFQFIHLDMATVKDFIINLAKSHACPH